MQQAKAAGFDRLRLVGEGDVADICRLTCLEQDVLISDEPGLPTIEVRGLGVALIPATAPASSPQNAPDPEEE